MRIIVAFKHIEHRREWLIRIKRWLDTDPLCDPLGVTCEHYLDNLSQAVDDVREHPTDTILLTVGYEPAVVLGEEISREERRQFAIVVHGPDFGRASSRWPSASLLAVKQIVTKGDPFGALKKRVLKLSIARRFQIRELEGKDDFRAYFALRYKTWKGLGYLLPEHDCAKSQWELDYLDRDSVPIGAFLDDGELVGCTRLVSQFGRESDDIDLIEELIEEVDSQQLRDSFSRRMFLHQSFDVLEAFEDFHEFYRPIARNEVKTAEVSRVIVNPDYRKQGLGEGIVDSAVALARSRSFEILFLACHEKHESFYERCGFRRIPGISAPEFSAGVKVPCIAMVHQLVAAAILEHLPLA